MQKSPLPAVVLASSSPYRRGLLERVLADFRCDSPAVDEAPRPGEAPEALASRLALAKACAVARRHPAALVIGADQVAVLGTRILGKPGGFEPALEQLMAASGRTLRFLTAVSLLDPAGQPHRHTDLTSVRFRRFDRSLAEAYLRHDEPYDCAGSFRVEGAGVVLFEAVHTEDPTSLVGLPMIWLAAKLVEIVGVGSGTGFLCRPPS
ncbi:MAG TPA: nucleoside triphosphate pyrophosphatase [Woeseiaceae bacterium]